MSCPLAGTGGENELSIMWGSEPALALPTRKSNSHADKVSVGVVGVRGVRTGIVDSVCLDTHSRQNVGRTGLRGEQNGTSTVCDVAVTAPSLSISILPFASQFQFIFCQLGSLLIASSFTYRTPLRLVHPTGGNAVPQ